MKIVDRIRTAVFLGSGAAVFLLIGATALVFWWSPMSPLSRDEPALLVSAGDMDGASQAYLQQSVGWGSDSEREEAMWRAAMLEAVELNHRRKAIRLLTEFQESWPESVHQIEAYLLLAKLYEPGPEENLSRADRRERLRKTAQSLELALLNDAENQQAGEWLVRIAGIWTELGDSTRVDATWRRVMAYESHRVEAMLVLANGLLPHSPEKAYRAFRDVLQVNGVEGSDGTLARLGMATALERMEEYDAAEQNVNLALSENNDDQALQQRKRRLEAIQ